MNDIELVKMAMSGNKGAFERLLILHSDRLYRTAYLYVGNREDALDIVQETACKAMMAIGQLRNEAYFLTWLTRILINASYEVLKKKKREQVVDMDEKLLCEQVNHEERIDLVMALGLLKEKHRTAIILFYYHDLPINEVASVMNIPENTVKTYLRRGKKRLKDILERKGLDGQEVVS